MTQIASPETVMGRFDGREVAFDGKSYRLERRGEEFWVEMPDPEWSGPAELQPRVQRQIVMTTGSHHMQVYWYPTGQKRKLGQFPLIYLKSEQRWIPRSAAFLHPPDLPFMQETARWNITCNRCHATHGRGRINGPNDIDTDVTELGIACEACHGPAEQHVRLNRNPQRRYRFHFRDDPDPSIVNPARLSANRSSQACGQCHGIFEFYSVQDAMRWSEQGYPFRPGDDLSATRIVVRHDKKPSQPMMQHFLKIEPDYLEGRFWSDGMVRISGREYNAMIESPCAQAGQLSCLSCHAMHKTADDSRPLDEWANDQLKKGMNGNQACLQCHDRFRNRIQEHTHHRPDSSGSQCYNCHMPHTTYGLMKAIRSHQINSPSVASSLRTGRPNACNLCHLDKTFQWTSEHLSTWYGQTKPDLTKDEQSIAASLLWLLRGEAGQRALIAWSMGWEPARQISGPDWMAPFLAQLFEDPYYTVRFIAHRSLLGIGGFESAPYDFIGTIGQRTLARRQVLERWERTNRAVPQPGPQVLLDSRGGLNTDEINRLLRQRDERPMNLKE